MSRNAGIALQSLSRTQSLGDIHHLPVWDELSADKVEPGVAELISVVKSDFAELEKNLTPTWSGLMQPLEEISNRLNTPFERISHLLSVVHTDELNSAFEQVRPKFVELTTEMGQSQPIYRGLRQLRTDESLTSTQLRIVQETIKAMDLGGVGLTGKRKIRFGEIVDQLSELSQQFRTNLTKEQQTRRLKVTSADEVAGIPAAVVEAAAATAVSDGIEDADAQTGPWHFQVSGSNYVAIAQKAAHRGLRERMYRAFGESGTTEGFDNRPIVIEILKLRQEQAKLLGFDSYAALSLDQKMAAEPKAVWRLLDQLQTAATPASLQEFAELKTFMANEGADYADSPAAWDMAFWMEKLRAQKFSYDSEMVRQYFQVPKVMDSLFSFMNKLYGIEIRQVPAGKVSTWKPGVEFYEVSENGQVISGLYVDLYERPGEKRSGAWMNTVVQRSRVLAQPGQESSLPVALFIMNARPPQSGKPGLLSIDEIETLFHEFGHALQHMLTRVHEAGASGMNLVEWDTVEMPSQFNENWFYQKDFIRNLSEHVETGESLDHETIDKIVQSRNFFAGTATLRQLFFAKTDMRIHEEFGLSGQADAASPFDIERQVSETTVVTPTLDEYSKLPAFGHLFAGGYAAGYYSYKWAEVMAADAFGAFVEVGLDDEVAVREVAQRFRDTVLAEGGSRPSAETYIKFRGRPAGVESLLKSQGLE